MKSFAALLITSIVALSACSGSGTTAAPTSSATAPTPANYTLTAYRMPLVHTVEADAASILGPAMQLAQGARETSGLGGLPTLTVSITDAPVFRDGAQINIAFLGVEAVGADGSAYPIVSYKKPLIVNILDYKKTALVLGSNVVPRQEYSSVRFIVQSSASSVHLFGMNYPVMFGSFDTKHTFTQAPTDIAVVEFPVKAKVTNGKITVIADINAAESLKIGQGVVMIGSRIAAAPYTDSSVIEGRIVNEAGAAVSSAIIAAIDDAGNVRATTSSNPDGTFELHAIVGGSYQLRISNDYTSASGEHIQATGFDSVGDVTVPQFAVPGGYKINLRNIVD